MDAVSRKDVRDTLKMLRQAADLTQSPLLSLQAVKRLAKQVGEAPFGPQTALALFIEEMVTKELDALRTVISGRSISSSPQTRPEHERRLAEDFRYGNRNLEAWSALYYRYLLPELNLQVQEIAKITTSHPKRINRRLEHGVRLLTEAIAHQEAESLQRISAQRRRLLANLPGVATSQIIGRDQELQELSITLSDTKSSWVISLEGFGGIGKTALAYTLVEAIINDYRFVDVACLSAKREVYRGGRIEALPSSSLTLDRLLDEVITQLEFGKAFGLTTEDKLAFLKKKLRATPYLIVIDNLETADDHQGITGLIVDLVRPTKFLLTSRRRFVLHDYISFEVKPLSKETTVQLVRSESRQRGLDIVASSEDNELMGIHEVTGGNPFKENRGSSNLLLNPDVST